MTWKNTCCFLLKVRKLVWWKPILNPRYNTELLSVSLGVQVYRDRVHGGHDNGYFLSITNIKTNLLFDSTFEWDVPQQLVVHLPWLEQCHLHHIFMSESEFDQQEPSMKLQNLHSFSQLLLTHLCIQCLPIIMIVKWSICSNLTLPQFVFYGQWRTRTGNLHQKASKKDL